MHAWFVCIAVVISSVLNCWRCVYTSESSSICHDIQSCHSC